MGSESISVLQLTTCLQNIQAILCFRMRPCVETQMIANKDAKRSLRGEGFATARPCSRDSSALPREVGEEKGKTKNTIDVTVMKDFRASADATKRLPRIYR